MKRSKKEKGLEDWEEKVLHGQYFRQTKEVRSDQCWTFLQNGDLKRDTKSLIVAPQNQSIRTNLVNPIQDGHFRGCSRMEEGKKDPLPKICHTYPSMMKLGTVIPYLRKIQKIYESRDTTPDFC